MKINLSFCSVLLFGGMTSSAYAAPRNIEENTRRLSHSSSDEDESAKLRVVSAGVCIGFPDLSEVEDGDKAIWVDCDDAPEFKMNADFALKFTRPKGKNGKGGKEKEFCLQAANNEKVTARDCDEGSKQKFYAFAVYGEKRTWRFYNKERDRWLGIYLEAPPEPPCKGKSCDSSSSSSSDEIEIAKVPFVPRLVVGFGTDKENDDFQRFEEIKCDFAFGED